ncbi:hypothetical protein Droror1_Dr00028180 [Drosera rotundifolia]
MLIDFATFILITKQTSAAPSIGFIHKGQGKVSGVSEIHRQKTTSQPKKLGEAALRLGKAAATWLGEEAAADSERERGSVLGGRARVFQFREREINARKAGNAEKEAG